MKIIGKTNDSSISLNKIKFLNDLVFGNFSESKFIYIMLYTKEKILVRTLHYNLFIYISHNILLN